MAVLALVLVGGCATPPWGNYRQTYQNSSGGGAQSTTNSGSAELGLQTKPAADLEVRVADRLVLTDASLESGDSSIESTQILHQPSVDTVLDHGTVRWTQGFDVRTTDTQVSGAKDNDRVQTNLLEKIEWLPEDLPRFTGRVEARTDRDDQFVDLQSVETVLQVQEDRGILDYDYSLELERIEDQRTDTSSDRVEHILRVGFEEELLDRRLTLGLNGFFDRRTLDATLPGSGPLPPGQVLPVAGISGIDVTPQLSTLLGAPGLIDGDTNTPSGINIGSLASGGQANWNFGLELQQQSNPTLLFVYTAQDVSLIANQLAFSLWVSDDNTFWTLASGAVGFTYETPFRRFRMNVPALGNRYIKLVNTLSPALGGAVEVTELQVFALTSAGGTQTSGEDQQLRNAQLNLSWRPVDGLLLGYTLSVGADDRRSGDTKVVDRAQTSHGLFAVWSPDHRVDVNARGELGTTTDSFYEDEDRRTAGGGVVYRPLDTLDFGLDYTWSDRALDGQLTTKSSDVQMRSAAQLLEDLRAEVSVGHNVQDDVENARQVTRWIFTGSLIARLTSEFDATLSLRHEPAEVTGAGADAVPDPSVDSTELLLLWRPSTQLTAQADLEWRDTFAENGLIQRYRLDWLPFVEGAVDVQFDYDRLTADTLTEDQDRYMVSTRWTMNRHLYLQLNWSRIVPEVADAIDTYSVQLNATL
ncbi:MAG: hypothetical protein NTY35_02280 [Planctomycetota bacterium]|nr:hypothetical protein [Planctomycetota bacterium]